MKKQYSFPTLLGLFLLIIGIAAGVFLVQTDKIFQSKASPEEIPQQVRITNVTDKGFTVSWTTDKAVEGFVTYGKNSSLGQVVQQQVNTNPTSLTHHVVVDSLTPQTPYVFKVGSGSKLFDNNGQLYQVKTAPAITIETPSPDIIFGTLQDAAGKGVGGAIVYVSLLGVTPLSVLTDVNGKWSLPLSTARTTNLVNFATYAPETSLEIFVQAGSGRVATAKVKAKGTHPVPAITLGQNHDFSQVKSLPNSSLPKSKINLPKDSTQSEEQQSGFSLEGGSGSTATIRVGLTSLIENEKINTDKPQFSGDGTPNLTFTITVSSTPQTGTVKIDVKGRWIWDVPVSLEAGNHTVTLTWKDELNQTRILKRAFVVLAAGSSELPSFTASSSGVAATTPTPSPSTTSTPTPIAIATTTPSATPKATATASATATGSARVGLPSTGSGTPAAGYLTPSIAIFIIGLSLILMGILFPKMSKFD